MLVETDSFAFSLRTVELLISPLTCKVYVVAFLRFIVSHNGRMRSSGLPPFTLAYINIIAYN